MKYLFCGVFYIVIVKIKKFESDFCVFKQKEMSLTFVIAV